MINNKKMVLIKWVDSSTGRINSWIDRHEYEPILVISAITIGFVIDEDTNMVHIAHSISKDQYMGEIAIPKCSIISMTDIPIDKNDDKRTDKNNHI